jgi:hypothetical protein
MTLSPLACDQPTIESAFGRPRFERTYLHETFQNAPWSADGSKRIAPPGISEIRADIHAQRGSRRPDSNERAPEPDRRSTRASQVD